MRVRLLKLIRLPRPVSLGLMLLAAGTIMPAQDNSGATAAGKLEGTWLTQVTVRDCQSGVALRSFPAMNTFHAGNTMTDTTTGASAAARTPGLGKWDKVGPQTYTAESIAFLFSTAGVWTGVQRLTHSIVASGDEISFESRVEISDTSGNVITRGCATATGRRL